MTQTLKLTRQPASAVLPSYDLAVFIGRFAPFHMGHLQVIDEALAHARFVCVLVGSANRPRSHRNPFTYQEREKMIRLSLQGAGNRLIVLPLEDASHDDEAWIANVQVAVAQAVLDVQIQDGLPEPRPLRITLIGHSKDHTSYYLAKFPQWDSLSVENYRGLSATPMRESYFSNIGHMWLNDCDGHKPGDRERDALVPPAVRDFLKWFMETPAYKAIQDEYEFIRTYRTQWANVPYPVTFVTVDAVVVQAGHVLLVKRKYWPGKGLSALPGGFVGPTERLLDSALRELREETGLDVPEKVLRGSLVAKDVFDDVHRSSRGRTITHAYLFHIPPNVVKGKPSLTRIKAGDDAEKVRWVPRAEIDPLRMHEDHYDIIQAMFGRLKD